MTHKDSLNESQIIDMYVMNIKWVIPDSPTTKHYMPAAIGADAKIDMITYSSLDEAMDKCKRYNNGEIEYKEFTHHKQ